MVADEVRVSEPGSQVDMFDPGLFVHQSRTDVDVVELLRVHVENIAVALRLGQAVGAEMGHVVFFPEEDLGLDKVELVEVAGGDNAGAGI